MEVNFQEQMKNYLGENTLEPVYQEEVAELVLPESMPQMARIIDCSGCLCLQGKDVGSGNVSAEGIVKVCVLYQPDEDGSVQKIERELPFRIRKDISSLESEDFVLFHGWIKRIDAKMLGNRKLLIRANIGGSFTAYTPMSMSIRTPQDPPKSLQLLKNTYEMMLPAYCGEREFRVNEEAILPETAAGISELLKASAVYQMTESKAVGDKAVFKGNILLHVLYLSAAGTMHGYDAELPFSQYVDMNGEAEEADVRVSVMPLSCEVETDGQEDSKRLLVNLSALAQAIIYEKQTVELYEDAYTTRGTLKPEWEDISVRARLDSQNISMGGELTMPAAAQKVVDAAVYTDHPIVRREENNMKVIVPVNANVIYTDQDGNLQGKEARGELTYDNMLSPSASCVAEGQIYDQPVCLASYDTVTVRMNAQLRVDCYMGSRLRTIKNAVIEQPEKKEKDRPSLIARRAGTESVWEIAKSCGSTVEAICEANGLSGGVAQEGAMLLIPMQ